MAEKLYIIKVGGNIIDNPEKMDAFLKDLGTLKENVILVHGGGKIATQVADGLGIKTQMVDGRRITDKQMLSVVTMVYGGLINKKIVSRLQSLGKNALGLTGADGNVIKADKRPAKDGVDFGFVGDPTDVNVDLLAALLATGVMPVMAPLTHDQKGNLLNTNADTIASALAVGLSKEFLVNLVYCFELPGVLGDVEDEDSLIEKITWHDYGMLKLDEIISDGMIPKLDNCFAAINSGVENVVICEADKLTSLINDQSPVGTLLTK